MIGIQVTSPDLQVKSWLSKQKALIKENEKIYAGRTWLGPNKLLYYTTDDEFRSMQPEAKNGTGLGACARVGRVPKPSAARSRHE